MPPRRETMRPAIRVLQGVFRAAMVAVARDVTTRSAQSSALVLAPHPDDETLGCGGTILLKRAAATPVTVCIASDGAPPGRLRADPRDGAVSATMAGTAALRRAEAVEACRLLGVDEDRVRFLGHGDGELRAVLPSLTEELAALIVELEPQEIYVSMPIDWHDDHQALFSAACAAVTRCEHRLSVLAYPVWFWSAPSWFGPVPSQTRLQTFLRRLRVLVGLVPCSVDVRAHTVAKRHALDAYEQEIAPFGDEFLERFVTPRELFFAVRESSTDRHGRAAAIFQRFRVPPPRRSTSTS